MKGLVGELVLQGLALGEVLDYEPHLPNEIARENILGFQRPILVLIPERMPRGG